MRGVVALLLLLFCIAPARAQSLEYFSLQMRWLPGQCLVKPEMTACEGLSLAQPQGRNLTLIGLKPEARPGSTPMRDCDPMARAFTTPAMGPDDKVTSCSLPPVKLSAELAATLAEVMPDLAACPERAFWAQYGSCALLSQQKYFERAVARALDLQRSLLNLTIAGSVGQRISQQVLIDAFEQQFGAGSAQSLQLVCAKTKLHHRPALTEIRVALNQLGSMKPLGEAGLWSSKSAAFKQRCPAEFLIAEPGTEEPPVPEEAPNPGEIVVPQPVLPPSPAQPQP